MKTVVREKRIPFEIRAENEDSTRQRDLKTFEAMQQALAASGISEMTLEEINAEIKAAREKY